MSELPFEFLARPVLRLESSPRDYEARLLRYEVHRRRENSYLELMYSLRPLLGEPPDIRGLNSNHRTIYIGARSVWED